MYTYSFHCIYLTYDIRITFVIIAKSTRSLWAIAEY